MGKESAIQWTEASYNPWHGCKKVSDGCKYCYMMRDKEKYGQDPNVVVRSQLGTFNAPLHWKEPKLIFTCSWSDWFIEEADEWREEAWAIIKACPQHTFQILTKRPERIKDHLPADWGEGYQNVWLGVSVENQNAADERIPILLEIPARIRFLSCEPLLGNLEISSWFYPAEILGTIAENLDDSTDYKVLENDIHWVIVGGESGNNTGKWKFRECDLGWIKYIVDQCRISNTPVFVKQLGTYIAQTQGFQNRQGGDIKEFPFGLQVREFPIKINQ